MRVYRSQPRQTLVEVPREDNEHYAWIKKQDDNLKHCGGSRLVRGGEQ